MPDMPNTPWDDLLVWLHEHKHFHLTADDKEFPNAFVNIYGDLVIGLASKSPKDLTEYCIHHDRVENITIGEKVAQIETNDGAIYTLIASKAPPSPPTSNTSTTTLPA